jgi:hypothetical protein
MDEGKVVALVAPDEQEDVHEMLIGLLSVS